MDIEEKIVELESQIIFPENTRPKLIKAQEMLKNKKDSPPERRHGNIPL